MIEVEMPGGVVLEFPDGTSQADMAKAIQKFDVSSTAKERIGKMGPFRKALYGAERSLDESAMGLKQLVVGLNDEEKRELAIRREMEDQIPGSWASRIAGDVVQWAAPSRLALGAAGRVAGGLPRTLATYGAAAGTGAAAGAIQPTLEGESRASNAALGAAFGGAGQAVGDVGGRAIEGLVKTAPGVHALPRAVRDRMTMGQAADRNSLSGRLAAGAEERAQSIPISGDVVRRARENGVNAWRDDVISRAAPDGFTPQGATTRDQMASIHGEFQRRYGQALGNVQINPSRQFEQEVLQIINNPQSGVPREEARRIANDILRNYRSRFAAAPGTATPRMTGQQAKDFESFLSAEARAYALSGQQGNPGARNLGNLYDALEDAWTRNYYGQMPANVRQEINALDARYAPFKTVERAAGARGNADPGNFTPAQLDESVATRTGRSRFARNEGLLQEQATQGREFFGNRIPDSGTPERGMWGMALGGVGMVEPTAAATALAVPPIMASQAGKRAMMGDTTAQQIARQLRLNQASRIAGLPAGISIADIMQEESERYANAPQ